MAKAAAKKEPNPKTQKEIVSVANELWNIEEQIKALQQKKEKLVETRLEALRSELAEFGYTLAPLKPNRVKVKFKALSSDETKEQRTKFALEALKDSPKSLDELNKGYSAKYPGMRLRADKLDCCVIKNGQVSLRK